MWENFTLSAEKLEGVAELGRLEREIAPTDAQIDGLVYDLYGITGDERKIIES